jgi:hypothetical protein
VASRGAEEAEEAEGVQKSDLIFNYVDLVSFLNFLTAILVRISVIIRLDWEQLFNYDVIDDWHQLTCSY